ncbi:hypothetical protein C0389_10215 [bacterium]|nr:hypothetical protein [bacterium]
MLKKNIACKVLDTADCQLGLSLLTENLSESILIEAISKFEEYILIVDCSSRFKSFFKSVLGNRFIIYDAASGVD